MNKKKSQRITVLVLMVLFISIFMNSCKDDDDMKTVQPLPTISSFTPESGEAGTAVTITGENFSTAASQNVVKISGVQAELTATSATELTVTIPEGAGTGKIAVTTNGKTATSEKDFVVLQAPVITSFSPESGDPGTEVMITGENFSETAAENIVKFNDMPAEVLEATATQLKVIVPDEATNGKITLTVNGKTATSEKDFVVFPSSFLLTAGGDANGVTVVASVQDGFGNTYITGSIGRGSTTLGNTVLTVTSYRDAFVAMYNEEQEFVWASHLESESADTQLDAYALAIDASGNAYVAGEFEGVASFGNTTLTSVTDFSLDMFIAKYNSSGQEVWAKSAGGRTLDRAYGIAVTPSEEIVITGLFQGDAMFGDIAITTEGTTNAFVATADLDGNFTDVFNISGSNAVTGKNIAVDASGNMFVSGIFYETVALGDITLTTNGGADVFLIKYTSSGDVSWTKNIGGTGHDEPTAIVIDDSGNAFIGGNCEENMTMGPFFFDVNDIRDVFIAKFNSSGEVKWGSCFGGGNYDAFGGITLDDQGDVYATGTFSGSNIMFGSIPLSATGYKYDAFITKQNSETGEAVWAKQAGGVEHDNGRTINVSPSGYVYAGGSFKDAGTFGDHTDDAAGHKLFIWKFKP